MPLLSFLLPFPIFLFSFECICIDFFLEAELQRRAEERKLKEQKRKKLELEKRLREEYEKKTEETPNTTNDTSTNRIAPKPLPVKPLKSRVWDRPSATADSTTEGQTSPIFRNSTSTGQIHMGVSKTTETAEPTHTTENQEEKATRRGLVRRKTADQVQRTKVDPTRKPIADLFDASIPTKPFTNAKPLINEKPGSTKPQDAVQKSSSDSDKKPTRSGRTKTRGEGDKTSRDKSPGSKKSELKKESDGRIMKKVRSTGDVTGKTIIPNNEKQTHGNEPDGRDKKPTRETTRETTRKPRTTERHSGEQNGKYWLLPFFFFHPLSFLFPWSILDSSFFCYFLNFFCLEPEMSPSHHQLMRPRLRGGFVNDQEKNQPDHKDPGHQHTPSLNVSFFAFFFPPFISFFILRRDLK